MTTSTNPPPPPFAATETGSENQPHTIPVEPHLVALPTSPTPPPSVPAPSIPPPVQSNVTNVERAPETQEIPVDPRIAALRAMFPDFDDVLLLSVLESVGGNQDRAVDALLGMSDPEFRADVAPPAENVPMTQTELDEQFARQLMLQEQQEQQEAWQAAHQQPPQHGGYAPYVGGQRSHSPSWTGQQQPQQQQSGNGNNTVSEFQQQFSRIAETGRKSLGTFFNKVKARLNELDNPTGGPSTSPPPQDGPSQHVDSWAQQQQRQANYFDPSTPAPPPRPTEASPAPIVAPSIPVPRTASSPAAAAVVAPPPEAQTPPPPSTRQGAPIDGGRIGLLPKRPVSLIRPEDNPPPQVQRRDSDDTLEYAENPFEEGSRR